METPWKISKLESDIFQRCALAGCGALVVQGEVIGLGTSSGMEMEGVKQDVLCSGNVERLEWAEEETWNLAVLVKLDFIP